MGTVDKRRARAWLEQVEPLMKCGHRLEFEHRLQWLSEGMLKNHIQMDGHDVNTQEQEHYRQYKEMV